MYDHNGNGYLNKVEAHHFCKKYYKFSNDGVKEINETVFDNWYKTLDHDGDD